MKNFVLIFWIASAVCNFPIEEISENGKATTLAFENITKHLFQLETRMFINNYGFDSNTLTWLLLENLSKKGMPFKLQNLQVVTDPMSDFLEIEKIIFDSSAFVIFDSFEKLRKFNTKLALTNEFYKPIQLFIYYQKATVEEINSLAKDVSKRHFNKYRPECGPDFKPDEDCYRRKDLKDIIQYEYFMVDEATSVKLLTFLWYSPGKCDELHLTEVNKFSKLTKKWENDKFVLQKLENLHNCEIGFKTDEWDEIPKILSSHLNYRESSKLKSISNVVMERACYDGLEEFLRDQWKMAKQAWGSFFQRFTTYPILYLPQRLAAPPGGLYSEYEKLMMPFDYYTWALIAATFVASFLVILILYFVKRSIRDFIIGSNVTSPLLNVVQIFFGISQASLPRRNFARYLTMLFILFCLIIRTAWQSKMYEFMQKDIAKPEVQTVEEMIEQGYTFYMEYTFEYNNPETEIAKRGKVVISYTETSKNFIESKIFEPGFKGVLQSNLTYEAEMANKTQGRFAERLRKEEISFKMCGMKFEAHDYFFGVFDLKSQQLVTAGIIQHETYEKWKGEIRKQSLKHSIIKEPRVLTMHMLEPGFVIWSSSLTFILFAFSLEWLITLKDYTVSKYIFRAFFRVQSVAGH